MVNNKLKAWIRKIFLQDLAITKIGFLYFLGGFVFMAISMEYGITVMFSQASATHFVSIENSIIFIAMLFSIIIGSYIVDKTKERMKLFLILSLIDLVGLFLLVINIHLLGILILIFTSFTFLINLITIVIHESTILNRGRLLGYLFFFSFLIGFIVIFITFLNPLAIFIFCCGFFVILVYISKSYTYVETKERLQSDSSFKDILFKGPFLGYLLGFLVLGFVLGNSFPVERRLNILVIIFITFFLVFFVITGILLDRMGRKWTLVAAIFMLSTIIIFDGIFLDFYNAIFLGMSISILFVLLSTFAGDFSTERKTIKYRGRIVGIFLFVVFGGFFVGILLKYFLTSIYLNNSEIYWVPDLINGINSILLILILVWLMPLPEILSAKEADWAKTLKNLYVFNKDSICLYAKNFIPEDNILSLNEDLIAGGLTGILTLISEITNERKNLRIIDKDIVKIYFSYGKNVIVALISTKFLPVLYKKMDTFTKAFERTFEFDLTTFAGKINEFQNKTDPLVSKYFK